MLHICVLLLLMPLKTFVVWSLTHPPIKLNPSELFDLYQPMFMRCVKMLHILLCTYKNVLGNSV